MFVIITVAIDMLAFGLIIPVVPTLVQELGNISAERATLYIGGLGTTYAFMNFLFGPMLGALSDRFGRRPVLLASIATLSIDFLIMGFANSIWLLFLGRALSGISGATYSTANAYIADVTEPENRGKAFGMVGAAFGFGFIFGPVMGGILGEFDPRAPFFAAAALALLNFCYGFFVLPESLEEEHRRPFVPSRSNPFGAVKHFSKLPHVSWFLVSAGVFFLAHTVYPSTWPIHGEIRYDWSPKEIGLSLGLVGLGAAGRFKSLQEESVRGQTQVVVTRVRLAYYQLLLSQEQERLTENSLHRVRKSLEETQALHRAGLASEYDVLRLQVELANLEPNVQRARNASMQARRQIAVELDISDQESLEVTGSLAEMDLEDLTANTPANREILAFTGFQGDLGDAVQVASELRSDVRQLALNEDLRRSEMRLEQVSYLPEVTLFGNYIINAQDNGSPNFFARGDGQRAYTRLVGVRVSLPIFQGFRRDARIDQKRALVRQAEAQTEKGIDQAVAQAKGLVEATDEAHQRARGQRLAVRQAERGFEIASAQYREGLSSQLELTDSEVALRQSEFNYAQAVYDYLVARAQLDEATGRVPLVDVDAQGDRF